MDPVGIDASRNRNEAEARDVGADIGIARTRLADARSRLDVAVAALPDAGDDEAMATPALLSLLLGAVTAKERLKELEDLATAGVPAGSAARNPAGTTASTGRILG